MSYFFADLERPYLNLLMRAVLPLVTCENSRHDPGTYWISAYETCRTFSLWNIFHLRPTLASMNLYSADVEQKLTKA